MGLVAVAVSGGGPAYVEAILDDLDVDLDVYGLVQVENPPLLFIMVQEQGPNIMKVVAEQKRSRSPLQISRGIHPKNDHERAQLHAQGWLEDEVVPKESDGVVVFVEFEHAGSDVLRG